MPIIKNTPRVYVFLTVFFFYEAMASFEDIDVNAKAFLSRWYESEVVDETYESCRYYSSNSVISYNKDEVYSPNYTSLNQEITKQLGKVKDNKISQGRNCLTVILSATGLKGNDVQRRYDNLYVRTTSEGPIYSAFAKTSQYEVAYFYFEDKGPFRHSEEFCIEAIKTLNPEFFKEYLPADYTLKYYEIHLISHWDACLDCVKLIYQNMKILKDRFKGKLFMFYHFNEYYWGGQKQEYPKFIYSIKYSEKNNQNKWKKAVFLEVAFRGDDTFLLRSIGDAESNGSLEIINPYKLKLYNKKLDKRADHNFKDFPNFYFGILHGKEAKVLKPTNF